MSENDRLRTVVDDLSALLAEKAFHETARYRTEVETSYSLIARGSSIAAAEREAKYLSLEHTLAVIDLDAKIAALMLEKEFLCRP